MNKIYKVIWNTSLKIWVAVSELAKGQSKSTLKKFKLDIRQNKSNIKTILKINILAWMMILPTTSVMAVRLIITTISGTGTFSIQSPGSTANDSPGIYTDWNNPNNKTTQTVQNMYAIAIGNNATAGNGSIVLGDNSTASAIGSIVLGNLSIAKDNSSIVIGGRAYSEGLGSIVLGRDATAMADHGIAIGSVSSALGLKSIAMGHSAVAKGANSLALGSSSTGTGSSYNASGPVASADYAIALGSNANANKENSIALGSSSTTATNATSENSATLNGITYNNFAGVVATGATGMQVSVGAAGKERQIKNVGSGAVSNTSTDAINGSQLYTTNDVLGKVANSTKNILGGTASLGTDGIISMSNIGGTGKNTVNEALISVQKSATDANTTLANNTAAALGGGAKYDAETGIWTAPSYNITDLSTGESAAVTNVGAAISALDTAVNTPLTFKDAGTGTSTNKLGSEFKFIGDSNLTTAVTQGQLAISLNKTLVDLTSVETIDGTKKSTMTAAGTTVTDGTNTTVYGADGLNINGNDVTLTSAGLNTGGVTVSATGIDANNQLIKNVADGTIAENSKDALNAGQAYEIKSDLESLIADAGKSATDANTTLANNTAAALGGGAKYDAETGIWTAPSYNITNLTTGESAAVTNVGAAISALDTAVNTPLTFKDAGTGTSTNKLGSEFKFIGDSNLTTAVIQGQLAISLNKTLTGLTSVETIDGTKKSTMTVAGTTVTDGTNTTVYGADGLNINGNDVTLTSAGLNTGGVTVSATGIDANNQLIKNVADGTIAENSKDALNAGQAYEIKSDLESLIADAGKSATAANTTLANNTAAALGGGAKYDVETGTWTGPSYNITNLTTGESTAVTNVGSAISALDAAVNTPLTFKDKGEGSSINKLGSEFKFIGDSNLTTAVTQGQLAISLNKTLTGLSSVETTDGTKTSTMTAAGTTVTDGTNTTIYGADGLNAGGVTVSASGIDANNQLIKNVADGTIAENSKDALNAGQAYEIKSDLESLIADAGKSATAANTTLANNTATALGGGANYDAETGTWTAPSYSTTDLTTGVKTPVNNVGSAISALDAAVNTPLTFKDKGEGSSINKLGSEFKFIGDSNLTTAVTQGQLAISLNKTLVDLTSVETIDGTKKSTMTAAGTTVTDGTNTTVYGVNGLDINNGTVSLSSAGLDVGGVTVSATGIDANNQLIKNVADAKDTGDATNLGQVENLIANASEGITNLGFSLQAEDGKTVTKKLGEVIDIVGDDQNISTVVSDNKISVVLAKDIVVDSINAGGSILNSTGLIIGNTQVTSDGIFVTGGPSLSVSGINAGNQVISNVANAVNANDAINKGQFDEAIHGLSNGLGDLAQSSVMYDTNADGSVNKNSITLGGENGTLITNLANGKVETGSKDAVNGGQLADVRDNLQGQITANTNNINEIQNNLVSGTIGLVQQQESAGQITVANQSAGTSVNFAGTSGNRVLTGVQAGRISQNSNDAVTGAQLNTNYENMANSLGGNAKFENGAWTGPSYVVGSGDDQKTVNSVGDAVSALNEADQALNTRLNGMGVQFDDALKSTNERLDKLSTKTNAAIAAAIAIASLPQPTEYGSSMLAVGTGVWEGETGLSIGALGVTTEKKIFNHKPVHYVWKFASTTNSRGHWGGGASVGIQWK